MAHTCDAIVVCCLDFRLQHFLRDWTDRHLKNKKFDLLCFSGSTKELRIILKEIEISVSLHQIKQAILIHHEDCGAYRAESTPQRHARDLKKAKAEILRRWPDLTVDLYYLLLSGEFKKVI
jgi:carbonic anhydrase